MSIWENLIDQKEVVKILTKAANVAHNYTKDTSRKINNAQMTQSWLITGPAGSGRSNAAKYFACALQCENPKKKPKSKQ